MALTLKLDLSATAIDSALSDYPVRVSTVSIGSTANADVFTEDSGSGADTWFSSDEAGSSPIDAKLLYWSDADSEFAFDVEVASVSATVATTIYLQVGSKPGAYGTDPYDASTEGVWPLMSDFDDDSSNGNDGTGNGGITAGGVTGPDGALPATDFDGADDYVATGITPTGATAYSLSCWANLDVDNADQVYFSCRGNGNDGIELRFDDTGFVTGRTNCHMVAVDDGPDFAQLEGATNSATAAGGWYHVAGTFVVGDVSGLRLYINGAEDANSPLSTTSVGSLGTPAVSIDIGRQNGTAQRLLNGQVAGAVAASTPRSAAWIKADYLLQGSGSATYWTVTDVTGGGGSNIPAIMYHRRLQGAA